jgi:hypothetical protein
MQRRHLAYVVCVASTVVSLIACTTDYQMGLEDPKFGAPNALAGQRQPGPTSEESSTDGTGTTTPECVRAGSAVIDGGVACAVSFKTDILGAFRSANCQTAGSCHGGTSPPNLPRIEPDDPGMWAEFARFKLTNGTPYINPCTKDKTKSSIACNVNKATPCGSIMPPGVGLPADVVTKIETWLECGSPNN